MSTFCVIRTCLKSSQYRPAAASEPQAGLVWPSCGGVTWPGGRGKVQYIWTDMSGGLGGCLGGPQATQEASVDAQVAQGTSGAAQKASGAAQGGSGHLLPPPLVHCSSVHCTALHCTALHCTALHCTAQHCTALHCTALHCTPSPPSLHLLAATLHKQYTTLHYITLQCTELYYNALYFTTPHYNTFHPFCVAPNLSKTPKSTQWFIVSPTFHFSPTRR